MPTLDEECKGIAEYFNICADYLVVGVTGNWSMNLPNGSIFIGRYEHAIKYNRGVVATALLNLPREEQQLFIAQHFGVPKGKIAYASFHNKFFWYFSEGLFDPDPIHLSTIDKALLLPRDICKTKDISVVVEEAPADFSLNGIKFI